jgi:glycosyltransferase involved in cell wall biosynthesis
MHPIVSEVSACTSNERPEKRFDVLMINPQNRKNPELMAKIIDLNPHLTFKVLKGGWGSDPFETFVPAIEETTAYKNGSVTLVDYERDMAQVYSSARLMFFPSYIEGYGMAAVEPMFLGTPVLASNFPPIIEAVGEKIDSLCPYTNDHQEWSTRLNEVLNREKEASALSQLRAIELKDRETEEIHSLIEFLKSMILKVT